MYIGIDGGGTRARAVLMSADGTVVHRLEAGAGIIDAADPARGAAAAAALACAVLAGAQGAPARVSVLCCGLAGAGRSEEGDAVRAALELAGIADRVIVVGDAEAAMADAFGSGAGVLLIAGTGSIAWAQDAAGRTVRVGGWGRLIGDEGSGFGIGVAAIRAVLRAADGRDAPTALTAAVLDAVGCAAPEELIRFAATAAKGQMAALTPCVLSCAAAHDPAAVRIREDAVAALVELVVTAVRRIGADAPRIALAGGLIEPGGLLRELVVAALRAAAPSAVQREARVDGARGAALLAMGAAAAP